MASRSKLYHQLGVRGHDSSHAVFESIVSQSTIDVADLGRQMARVRVPADFRVLAWKVRLGVLPPERDSWLFVERCQAEQFEDWKAASSLLRPAELAFLSWAAEDAVGGKEPTAANSRGANRSFRGSRGGADDDEDDGVGDGDGGGHTTAGDNGDAGRSGAMAAGEVTQRRPPGPSASRDAGKGSLSFLSTAERQALSTIAILCSRVDLARRRWRGDESAGPVPGSLADSLLSKHAIPGVIERIRASRSQRPDAAQGAAGAGSVRAASDTEPAYLLFLAAREICRSCASEFSAYFLLAQFVQANGRFFSSNRAEFAKRCAVILARFDRPLLSHFRQIGADIDKITEASAAGGIWSSVHEDALAELWDAIVSGSKVAAECLCVSLLIAERDALMACSSAEECINHLSMFKSRNPRALIQRTFDILQSQT